MPLTCRTRRLTVHGDHIMKTGNRGQAETENSGVPIKITRIMLFSHPIQEHAQATAPLFFYFSSIFVNHIALQRRDMIHKELPVQMVNFMLNNNRKKPFRLQRML